MRPRLACWLRNQVHRPVGEEAVPAVEVVAVQVAAMVEEGAAVADVADAEEHKYSIRMRGINLHKAPHFA